MSYYTRTKRSKVLKALELILIFGGMGIILYNTSIWVGLGFVMLIASNFITSYRIFRNN